MNHDNYDSAVKVIKTAIEQTKAEDLRKPNKDQRKGKTHSKRDDLLLSDENYIKNIILDGKISANIEVHNIMINTFYHIGQILNSKMQYDDEYIQRFANDLSGYGRTYSFEQLTTMKKLAKLFDKKELLINHIYDLEWGKTATILYFSDSKEEIIWYLNQAYRKKWDIDEIVKNLDQHSYKK